MRTAIEEPEAFRAARFATKTPGNYNDELSTEEIDTLVKYLLSVDGGKVK